MCVICISEAEILDEDLIAYKVVRQEDAGDFVNFISRFLPKERELQALSFEKGIVLNYEIDKETVSKFEMSYGVYCYENEQDSRFMNILQMEQILKVRIPKGTKIKRGKEKLSFNCFKPVILAEVVIPFEVV